MPVLRVGSGKSVSLGNIRLNLLVPALLVALAAFGSISVGIIGYQQSKSSIEQASRERLEILASSRQLLLDSKLDVALADLESIAASSGTAVVLDEMGIISNTLSSEIPTVRAYFSPADSDVTERAGISGDGGTTMYAYRHRDVHASFASIWRNGGYGDIYIVNADGYVLYSVTKSGDFLVSLDDPQMNQTGLAQAVQALKGAEPGAVVVTDTAPYALNGNSASTFLATTTLQTDTDGSQRTAYVVFRLDAGYFDTVLQERDGLGETEQTYVVDGSGRVLNNQPLSASKTALVTTIDDAVLKDAANAQRDFSSSTVSLGRDALIYGKPLHFLNTKWAVVAERSVAESYAGVNDMGIAMAIGTVAILVVATVLGILAGRTITRPVQRLTGIMGELAGNKLEAEVPFTSQTNELGEMARAVEVFRANAIKVRDMTEAEAARLERTQIERAEMMQSLQQAFGEVVDAAIAGDFSQRVTVAFPDAELNALAGSVNDLVQTVDRGISESGKVLSALAQTDLTQRVTGTYQGQFERLKQDTNSVAEKLAEIVHQLRQTSRGLKTATGEILSGANDLSERTTRQAATIEETSAAMDQLAATVIENAQRANSASDQAKTASHAAHEGGAVMREANQAMERISHSSAKISNIIGMIDDIAFQTNLLALNASVEAARAGEAGKGFAVVAIEVRRLAQSAAEASSDVKSLIEQSGEEVTSGTRLVASASEKLDLILEAVKANADQMEQIARDSQEQASAIEEVNVAVRQMDEMTQHNAALVEETNAAIEQTEAQASELDRIVDVFAIEEETGRRSRAA